MINRLFEEEGAGGDLLVGFATRQEAQHFNLSLAEAVEEVVPGAGAVAVASGCRQETVRGVARGPIVVIGPLAAAEATYRRLCGRHRAG